MDRKAVLVLSMLVLATIFLTGASAADDAELMAMREAVLEADEDWTSIEAFLFALSPEDRELVIETYPDRLAELEEIKRAINETGANWTAGLNPVFLLPPERRGGVGTFPIPAEAEGVPQEIVTIGPGEGVPAPLALPTSWDWRTARGYDWTTPIKDQGQCGSCWAFGALGAVEARVKLAADNPGLIPDFSEQYLLSCSPGDCGGWYMDEAAGWLLCEGTVDEACFPYAALDTIPCSDSCFDRESRKYKSEGWSWVCDNWYTVDVDRIKQEILSGGPVATFMYVYDDFGAYNGGVYKHTYGDYRGGHSVDIVGWGNDGVDDYWICKNSWGPYWGEAGWFRIKMGEVSIGTQAIAYQPKVRGKVLFYEGHLPDWDFELSKRYGEWGNRLAGSGYLVHRSTTSPLTLDLLSCYDVVIISNPATSFSAAELAAVEEFVKRGRVIASGDGDLFAGDFIYKQDNEKVAVQYVDWLATGDGGGLLVMGERAASNSAINQVASLFGLKINSDTILDPLRNDGDPGWPILGPEENVLVLASASLDISKDALPLARATSSGYAATAAATYDPANSSAASFSADFAGGEVRDEVGEGAGSGGDLLPPELGAETEDAAGELELELSTMSIEEPPVGGNESIDSEAAYAGYEIPPEDMPPVGEMTSEGELTAPSAIGVGEMEAASTPVPLAVLPFEGPIGIAAVDFGRKGEDTIGRVVSSGGANWYYLDYDNDGSSDKVITYGSSVDIPIIGDWNGDGKDTIGRVVASGGRNVYFMDYDNDGSSDISITYGSSVDIPIIGDWNSDGKDTIGRVVASGGKNLYYMDYNNDGSSDKVITYGSSLDKPIVGDWLKKI